ncbi:hypothetical protein Fmac_020964 [Flemingia macrophylla]|uniref:Uncharacterized protein n=1 Tax=Flemingia macrophylla TaxID=520843 RepID=A0ABD1LVG0_9FABA
MDRMPLVIKRLPTTTPKDDRLPQPLVIKVNKEKRPNITPLRILTPRPFPYESDKTVPWKYDVQTSTNEDISNIARIGGMKRNGRIYTPKDMQDKAPKEKEKIEEKEEESKEKTDENPSRGTEPQQALAKVLVDNGSSLNVMPKHTLEQVAIKGIHMRPSNTIVRAFDRSKREVVGEINLPIQIGPTIFNVEFQVIDITSAYSCLFVRPWIHDAKAVPSTLHQKFKFVVGDKLVTVQAEDDALINKPPNLPYVDAAEEAIETSFQALEIANVEKFPRDMKKVAQMLTRSGY